MEQQRTRNFAESGTGIVDVDGLKLHARWRIAGTQQYLAGAGASVDGRRDNISITLYFDKLPDEAATIDELLQRITADRQRTLAVDLGRTGHPAMYWQETRMDQGGNPSGITLADQPAAEAP
jgi:hypothetical protein